jgi:hypothetical protein
MLWELFIDVVCLDAYNTYELRKARRICNLKWI